MVQLKRDFNEDTSLCYVFQFHNGTIKTYRTNILQPCVGDFNSIMVQLKLTVNSAVSETRIFQFHNGTIKTTMPREGIYQCKEFQFHNGTIKTDHPLQTDCFLSTISIP